MNLYKKGFLAIALLASVSISATTDVVGNSFFQPLSQRGTARGLVGLDGKMHRNDMDKMYGSLKYQGEYSQNFDTQKIGKFLFPNTNNGSNNTLVFGAPAATVDVSSVNFFLGNAHAETLTTTPKVQNFTSDFTFHLGLDEWMEGLYLCAHAPLVWARHDMKLVSSNKTASTALTVAYVSDTAAGVSAYSSAIDAFKGDKVFTAAGGNVRSDGLLKYGRIDGARDLVKLGDVEVALGYNFVCNESCHLGVELVGTFGAGGKSKAVYMFEPMVGNGGHAGIGGGLTGHMRLWERDEDQHLCGYLSASVSHLFDAKELRSYDFTTNGVGSRYLLLKKFDAAFAVLAGTSAITNAINVTTLNAKIGVDVVYNACGMLAYQNGGFSVNAGYELDGRSAEEHRSWVDTITGNYGTYGGAVLAILTAANTSYQSDVQLDGLAAANAALGAVGVMAAGNVLSNASLNKASALHPSCMQHGVFGSANYCWLDSEWMPTLGVGGSAHFSGSGNKALNQWGVFALGSLSF